MISRKQREEIRNRALTAYTAVQPQPTFAADVVLDLIANVEWVEYELGSAHRYANTLQEAIDMLRSENKTMTEANNHEVQAQREMIAMLRKKLHELGVSA